MTNSPERCVRVLHAVPVCTFITREKNICNFLNFKYLMTVSFVEMHFRFYWKVAPSGSQIHLWILRVCVHRVETDRTRAERLRELMLPTLPVQC